jgi:signal transduction histidine kinase
MSNQSFIPDEEPFEQDPSGRPEPGRPAWLHRVLTVLYVLLAGPRGLGYLLLLGSGLVLDLSWLALRLLLAIALSLASTVGRVLRWLARAARDALQATLTTLRLLPRRVHNPRDLGTILRQVLGRNEHSGEDVLRPQPGAAPDSQPRRSIRQRLGQFFAAWAEGMKRMTGQAVAEPWAFISEICWRLVMWERRHTMGWLNINLPSLEAPRSTATDRTFLMSQLPIASFGYVLAKGPLGALALLVPLGAGGLVLVMAEAHLHRHYPLVFVSAIILEVLVGIFILSMLGRAEARFARRVFSPSPAVRRLQAAEALVAQERLKAERAEQSRRDLIINVGHELRTPTASILGHVESLVLALDSPAGELQPATLRGYLAIVEREAGRLSSLVDDLLSVAQAERAELQLVLAPVDAADVIREVYEALAPLARRERQVMLIHEEQSGLPAVRSDRQRLSQVLLNLVRNAITYTPTGGIVSLGLRCAEGDRLLLTVADTGSGIAPDDLERVFERFYRTDASRARSSGGFGLGLAIARDLVEAMGGTITVESVVGEGSCFQVSLPIFNDSAAAS